MSTKNEEDNVKGDRIDITIGDHASQVAAGKNIHQTAGNHASSTVTDMDLAKLRELVSELRRQVDSEAPADKKTSALERVDELESAVTARKSDMTTIEYVKNWFGKNLPQLSGSVVSVLVNPIVGKVVEAVGEITAAELKSRLGIKND